MSRALIPALLACALLTAGCAGDEAPSPRTDRDRQEPRAQRTEKSPPPTASPSAPAEPKAPKSRRGTPKIAPALPEARRGGSRAHLLTPDTLPPAANATWTVRGTRPEGTRVVGACQAASLVDIGALDAAIRVFTGPDDSGLRSRQLVARLPDAKSAWRAHEVLRSWRTNCAERLESPNTVVGPMRDLDLDPVTGGHYRSTYGPRKAARTAGLGIVRSGRWLSVVEITASDGEVPRGWARRAVHRIAATFSG